LSDTLAETLHLMRIAGALACASGRARDDCPYNPVLFPEPYFVWCEGWDEAHMALRAVPIGG